MILDEWAEKWNVPKQAMHELYHSLLNASVTSEGATEHANETAVSNRVRLAFREETSGLLWRNNVGVAQDRTGRMFRYGLANDSKRVNEMLKSGDLIGIRPVTITPEHVGNTIGQFVSREVKAEGWSFKGTKREKAQAAWALLINRLGGDAKIVNR